MKNWSTKQIADELQRVTSELSFDSSEEWQEYVFVLCLALAEKLAASSKFCKTSLEIDEFSLVIAEELYYILLNKNVPIQSMKSYVESLMPQFCGVWLRMNDIHTVSDETLAAYYDPNHARRYAPDIPDQIVEQIYTGDAIKESWDALHKYIRYYKWESKVASRNAHLSMLLSIRHDKFVNFHLGEKDAKVCRLLFNRYRLLLHDLLTQVTVDTFSDSIYLESALSYIYDSNGMGEQD